MEKTRLGKTIQGYGYKYTDLAQINQYCEERGITYYQYIEPVVLDNSVIDYMMTVITRDDKEKPAKRGVRLVDATLQGIKNPAQEQGSATTYARRYSLLMALGLATEDDDGAKLIQSTLTPKQVNDFKNLAIETETDLEKLKKYYKVKDIRELNETQYEEAMSKMSEKQ